MNRVIAIYTVVSVSAVGLLIWAIGPGHDLMGRRNTTYAKGYSESAFDAVNVGMTREEVIQLLGDPMDVTVTREGRQPISVTLGEDVLPDDKMTKFVFWYAKPNDIMSDYELVQVGFRADMLVKVKVKWVTD